MLGGKAGLDIDKMELRGENHFKWNIHLTLHSKYGVETQ